MKTCRLRDRLIAMGLLLAMGACASNSDPVPEPTPSAETGGETVPAPQPEPNPQPQPDPQPNPGLQGAVFRDELWICPLMTVSNRPEPIDGLTIVSYKPFANVDGIEVAVAPVEKGCLSSGFGPRGDRMHKGIDLHNASAVDVYAAAGGIVREKNYYGGYGNQIVLDHGRGVYTRYAHLDSFTDTLNLGDSVRIGETIGVMGTTADFPVPRHLHYEVLTGEWGSQAGAFALTPIDIFDRLPEN